ncbi:MAG: type II 3-dehydroquinate dehydratase [Chloroflexota bacterium]
MSNVLVLHGPNLNLLGVREPDIYGRLTLQEIDQKIAEKASELGLQIASFQSNYEGKLIDLLQEHIGWASGALLNPGAFTHYSYALRDAVGSVPYPVIEVHLSLPARREHFRRRSVIAPACQGQVAGFGWHSYEVALDGLAALLRDER